MLLLVAYQYQI